ncbi:Uncharacterised protein [Candidatus Bartonella washoeensis]|uniref:Uncharacterized protein n=2 Tax=Candidatus Bartonella washoeensis TaxID=186739 RepID=J0ZEN9_9HYPH|nr:hypothetical protein [Bartonella washoeensis]EJF77074.1 hypothetical protein MCQ_01578 [Bartonella washoeensis Sb944nv]EJF86463.1 hypothetical protein MCW_00359 [Bartonella washoeensis 085-0475]SPU27442.1 Uncharacterised protein [Bartonella washoeensis]
MIDRNYPVHEKYKVVDKTDREKYNSFGKGIFAILLGLFIIWFIFGFLGSLFEKSPEHVSHYNTTKSSETVTSPKKDLNPVSPMPYPYKGTTSPLFDEQNSSEERIQPSIGQEVK